MKTTLLNSLENYSKSYLRLRKIAVGGENIFGLQIAVNDVHHMKIPQGIQNLNFYVKNLNLKYNFSSPEWSSKYLCDQKFSHALVESPPFWAEDHFEHVTMQFFHHNKNLLLIFEHIVKLDDSRVTQALKYKKMSNISYFFNTYGQNLDFVDQLIIFLIWKTSLIDNFYSNIEWLPPMTSCVNDPELTRSKNFIPENLQKYVTFRLLKKLVYFTLIGLFCNSRFIV